MPSIPLGPALLALGLFGSQPVAAQAASAVRRVEIVSMASADGGVGREDGASERGNSAASPISFPVAEAFRTHDLSRRWVAFEMANSFAAADHAAQLAETSGGSGAARAAPALQPAAAAFPPPVFVPSWMRGGVAFSAAATSGEPGCAISAYRPTGFLDAGTEARRFGYYGMMRNIACEYGIPIGLFDAMIIRESRYKADVSSPKAAFGLTQLMPGTAAGLGVNRYDVEQNLRGGARYLRQQLDNFGHVHLALAAYNAGPGRVRNGMIPRIAETQAYVDNVLLNWRRLAGLSSVATVGPGIAPALKPRAQPGRMATVASF